MIHFTTVIKRFGRQGEKTGWTYIEIPQKLANQLNPGIKTSFRVKGRLDQYPVKGLALLPMGEGNFILPLNADIRKKIKKGKGAMLEITFSLDREGFQFNQDFISCLRDDEDAFSFFNTLSGSMQRYFSKWIDSAKQEPTRIKRIALAVNALSRKQNYSEMLRSQKRDREEMDGLQKKTDF